MTEGKFGGLGQEGQMRQVMWFSLSFSFFFSKYTSVISYTDVRFISMAAGRISWMRCCGTQQEMDEMGCGQECYLYKMS